MDTLAYHCHDYRQSHACNTCSVAGCQHRPDVVNWYSPPPQSLMMYTSLQRPSSLPFGVPSAYRQRYLHEPRWHRHHMAQMSPPALTRCLPTLSPPFTADHQAPSIASQWASSPDTTSAKWFHTMTAGQTASSETSSSRYYPHYVNGSSWRASGLTRCPHDPTPPGWPSSNQICRSLIEPSKPPAALNDAICRYIDYLTRDNDRVIGEISVVPDIDLQQLNAATMSKMVDDELYRDIFCRPASFPTSRFREWLQIHSVELVLTDPEGRRVTQHTFAGCGCAAHQLHADQCPWPADVFADYPNNQLMPPSAEMLPALTVASESEVHAASSSGAVPLDGDGCPVYGARTDRGRGSRGRPARRSGSRGPGRGGGGKRKSSGMDYSEMHAYYSSAVTRRPLMARYMESSSAGDSVAAVAADYSGDDSGAVVEFLAELQSDAVKRRRQLELLRAAADDSDKVIEEEVVDDHLHLDEQDPHARRVPASSDCTAGYDQFTLAATTPPPREQSLSSLQSAQPLRTDVALACPPLGTGQLR